MPPQRPAVTHAASRAPGRHLPADRNSPPPHLRALRLEGDRGDVFGAGSDGGQPGAAVQVGAAEVGSKAEALRSYTKQANNREAEVQFSECKVRAEMRCGELLQEMAAE